MTWTTRRSGKRATPRQKTGYASGHAALSDKSLPERVHPLDPREQPILFLCCLCNARRWGRDRRLLRTLGSAFPFVRPIADYDMTVHALARNENPGRAGELGVARVFPRAALHAMLAGSDAVVLATPRTPETEGMIGPAELAAMRSGAILINIARGTTVDEPALIDALRSGQVGFVALDVTAVEPLPADSPLWDLPNVLISPHSASTVAEENALITERFIANLGHYLSGDLDRMGPQLDKTRLYYTSRRCRGPAPAGW